MAASLLGHADTAFLERTYCHPQDVAKQQAANLMQDLLNSQNPCYVAFMKNKNRKAKKAITTPNNLSPKILPITDKNGTAISDGAAAYLPCFLAFLFLFFINAT